MTSPSMFRSLNCSTVKSPPVRAAGGSRRVAGLLSAIADPLPVDTIRSAGSRMTNVSRRPPLFATDVFDSTRSWAPKGASPAAVRTPPKPIKKPMTIRNFMDFQPR